jgi:NAD(P)H-hydrate epimerase
LENPKFKTQSGQNVPAVDAAMMRRVDRIVVEQYSYGILQMMENAGRMLAQTAIEIIAGDTGKICIMAGSGGNGGGGLCCARHLLNRGFDVYVVLTKPAEELVGAARSQIDILLRMGLLPVGRESLSETISASHLIIDTIIGYGLTGAPNESVSRFIYEANDSGRPILSLDIPSGMDASTGAMPGAAIRADKTLTLALPKLGLGNPASGDLILCDIGIPNKVFEDIGIRLPILFDESQRISLVRT